MNTTSQNILAFALWTAVAGCNQSALNSSVSTTRRSGLAVAQVESGTMIAKDSTKDTMISTSDTEVIIGAGTLQVDTAISVDNFKASNSAYIADELGMSGDEVSTVTVAHVTATAEDALMQPMTIKLKIGDGGGLFATFLSDPNYFVVYSYRSADDQMVSGIISGAKLTIADGFASFKVDKFGVFELFKSRQEPPAAKVMVAGMMNPFGRDIAVTGLSTALLATGQSVTITGDHFDRSTRVKVFGQKAAISQVTKTALTFTVPAAAAFGEGRLIVANRYKALPRAIFYKGDKTDLPMIASEPSQVCVGTAYYDGQGAKKTGQKICAAADFPDCKGSMRQNCLAKASYLAADLSTIDARHILAGRSIAGVSGSLNLDDLYTYCTRDGQRDCRAQAGYVAINASLVDPSAIKAGVTIAGVAGTLVYPTKALCSASKTGNCKISSGGAFTAVDADQLKAEHIRKGKTIGGVTGIYPSAAAPLPYGSLPNLTAGTLNQQLQSSGGFQFYDSSGVRYIGHGDNALTKEHLVENVSIFGVTGTFAASSVAMSTDPWDYQHGYSVAGTTGKLKTNCRSLVMPGHPANVDRNVAGHLTIEPTINPWGDERYACGSEGWHSDSSCDPRSQICQFKDLKTKTTWRLGAPIGTKTSTDALSYCDALVDGGHSDWRVPSQKEALQAVINGISAAFPASYRATLNGVVFYTSTISTWQAGSANPPYWYLHLSSGIGAYPANPDAQAHVVCVR